MLRWHVDFSALALWGRWWNRRKTQRWWINSVEKNVCVCVLCAVVVGIIIALVRHRLYARNILYVDMCIRCIRFASHAAQSLCFVSFSLFFLLFCRLSFLFFYFSYLVFNSLFPLYLLSEYSSYSRVQWINSQFIVYAHLKHTWIELSSAESPPTDGINWLQTYGQFGCELKRTENNHFSIIWNHTISFWIIRMKQTDLSYICW